MPLTRTRSVREQRNSADAGDGERAGIRSPLANLSRADRKTLLVLMVLAGCNGIGLIFVAEALASGIVAAIEDEGSLRFSLMLGVVGGLLRGLATWGTSVVAARNSQAAQQDARRSLLERLLADGGASVPSGSGGITALATRGLAPLDDWYGRFLPALSATLVVPVMVGLRILWSDWVSALIIALTLPLVPVFMILIGQETRERVALATDGLQRLANHLAELARGLPVLVGLGRAKAQTVAMANVANEFRIRTMATLRVAFMSSLALELISTLSVAVVAVFIGVRLVNGSFDLQTGLLVLILAPECYLPLRQIGAAFHATEDGEEARRRISELTMLPAGPRLPGDRQEFGRGIETQHLSVTYPGRTEAAVDNLSFRLEPGQIAVLRGASGRGKSTVLAAMLDMLPVGTHVEGTISGVDLASVAYLPQRPVLVTETAQAEVDLFAGSPGDTTQPFLEAAGAASLTGHHPAELSAGEGRRVALARTLARVAAGATIVLLDEPTAHLDGAHAEQVIQAIENLPEDRMVLVVSHDDRLLGIADQVIDLSSDREQVPASLGQEMVTGDDSEANEGHADTGNETAPPGRWQDLGLVIGGDWPRFALSGLAGAASLASGVALTALSGWLIVRASEQPPILYLLAVIVGVRFFGIARSVLRYVERLLSHDAILRAMTHLRLRIWRSLANQGPSVSRKLRGERAVDILIREVDTARDLTLQVMVPMVAGWAVALMAVVAAAMIVPAAALVLAMGLGVGLIGGSIGAVMGGGAAGVAEVGAASRVTQLTGALVAAAPDLRANRVDGRMLARLREAEGVAARAALVKAAALGGCNSLVVMAMIGTALGMLALVSTEQPTSAGMMAVLVLLPIALIEPVSGAVDAVQRWPALAMVLGRLKENVEIGDAAERDDAGTGTALRDAISWLSLSKVTTGWAGRSQPVLRNVDMDLRTGEWMTVTGPSGAGKSTLLSLLMCFLRPWTGMYRINGADTETMDVESVRRQMAWCPQDAHVFDSSIRANLLLARDRSDAPTDAEMLGAMEQVGLTSLISGMADGLDTRIGEAGRALSGGERQRLAVARMLLTGAPVMLIDEPTAHLDDDTAKHLMCDLRSALREKLVVTVTHRQQDIGSGDTRLNLGAQPRGGG